MSDVVASRSLIQVEDVTYGAAVSEATAYKKAENINHQNENQLIYVDFKFNNDLGAFETGLDYADGSYICLRNFDIVGVYLNGGQTGTSGTLDIDIKRLTDPGGTPASIFSVTPKLTSAAGSYAFLAKDFTDNTTTEPAAGYTHATLAVTQLNKFDVIFPVLNSVQNAQVDAQITLILRIR